MSNETGAPAEGPESNDSYYCAYARANMDRVKVLRVTRQIGRGSSASRQGADGRVSYRSGKVEMQNRIAANKVRQEARFSSSKGRGRLDNLPPELKQYEDVLRLHMRVFSRVVNLVIVDEVEKANELWNHYTEALWITFRRGYIDENYFHLISEDRRRIIHETIANVPESLWEAQVLGLGSQSEE